MDPWADSPTPAKSNSPWETPTNGNSKQSADDDFDMLISRTSAPSSQPGRWKGQSKRTDWLLTNNYWEWNVL